MGSKLMLCELETVFGIGHFLQRLKPVHEDLASQGQFIVTSIHMLIAPVIKCCYLWLHMDLFSGPSVRSSLKEMAWIYMEVSQSPKPWLSIVKDTNIV